MTSTANLRSKILWRHVLGPRMLWIYYRGLVYNSGLTRANRVSLEVRVSTYVPECLSLPLRHPPRRATDETTNVRNDIVPPCSANNVAPIPTYAPLVFLPPIFPSSTSFFFSRLFLSNYANARSYGETRILKTRTSFSEMNFLSRRMQTRLWLFFSTKKIVANCMLLYRLFSLLDLKDFGYFFFDILFNYLIEEVKIVSLINLQFNVEFSK